MSKRVRFGVLVCLGIAGATSAHAQPARQPPASTAVDLSLQEAIARAAGRSEEVELARAAVESAETQITAARSAGLPQLNATTSYARTFVSPFTRGLEFRLPDEDRFNPDPTAPLEERVTYLEQNADSAVLTTLADILTTSLQGVGLGSPHAYTANLSGSQVLYSGGRISAALGIATAARDAARFTYEEEVAEAELAVRTAYYRALLARELESIAQAALVQAESFLNQERLRLEAGFASDLDVMRAEVALENLRPELVQARNALELAMLDLKRLVNLPLSQPIRLTTPLEIPTGAPPVTRVDMNELLEKRAALQAARRQVAAGEYGVRAARAEYLPAISLQVAYGGQTFPQSLFGFGDARWQPNGSATVAVQIPLFSGFQRGASVGQARVELRRAELQEAQLREAVQLQYEQALGERERARATISARQRTVDQAQRVYDLTVLRYEQGQATQLEITDARLALLEARTNLAQALTDFHIADAGVNRAMGVTTVSR